MTPVFDKLVKQPIFGCQQCGQCLLSQTAYVCPMTCPKGLRNGPCGGTTEGMCEVLPDRPCVWLGIREKKAQPDGLYAPFDPALVGTSSLVNFLRGRDKPTRLPQSFTGAAGPGLGSESVFARKFQRGSPVITYEIASPRDRSGLTRVETITQAVQPFVDGINTTTNAGGIPSLHSLETARFVVASGVPPIVQICGRDQGPEDFETLIHEALSDGFANFLVLTGDWNPHWERARKRQYWFPMDSVQMVDSLAGMSGYVKHPFVGVASTAYMTPMQAGVTRLQAKLQAGADFTQTQVVTETTQFGRWLDSVRAFDEGRNCRILASVPLIGKRGPYHILRRLPGVVIDPEFAAALEAEDDLTRAGLAAARDLVRRLLELNIDGLHLMNFGVPLEAAVDFIQEVRGGLTSAETLKTA